MATLQELLKQKFLLQGQLADVENQIRAIVSPNLSVPIDEISLARTAGCFVVAVTWEQDVSAEIISFLESKGALASIGYQGPLGQEAIRTPNQIYWAHKANLAEVQGFISGRKDARIYL